ncbi:MAG: DUF3141 domain-containing protein, partial [Bradyrhizobium sp.]|nr:DUF3141 domain-containing protein [Bradyrhizobium sp.]
DPDCRKPHYSVRFESRRVEDLHFSEDNAAFKRVNEVSEATELLYNSFFSPWVRMLSNPWTAEAAKWLHPMRLSRYLFSSSFSPGLRAIAGVAESLRRTRQPLPYDHPMLANERALIEGTTAMLEAVRMRRDSSLEAAFRLLYGGDTESAKQKRQA